ncbi:uncharacterized protein LOC117106135 [Anneissia japonica]|uniref:uncharacterized protein LOC117106135 n=1 Tax=Anneissia japonica TaxID=1529436 RepID=UPI001425A430|nr:uncharacterized protein LOC117106135 [Anneissia japonica]
MDFSSCDTILKTCHRTDLFDYSGIGVNSFSEKTPIPVVCVNLHNNKLHWSDGGVTNEDLKDLYYEALGELIPTQCIKGILVRSTGKKIWLISTCAQSQRNH